MLQKNVFHGSWFSFTIYQNENEVFEKLLSVSGKTAKKVNARGGSRLKKDKMEIYY